MNTFARCVPAVLYGALLAATAHAFADEAIATDRPDVVESGDVVGAGRIQIETGVAFERDRSGGVTSRLRSTPTLLRVGTGERWELRLETDGALRQRITEAGLTQEHRGTADLSLGAKWHWRDGDEKTGAPGMAWLFHVDIDAGSAAFRGHGLRPSLRMVAEWDLPGGWSTGVMPGLYTDRNAQGERYVGGIFAVTAGKSLTERLRGFVEFSGQQLASTKNGGSVVTFDTGLAYLLSDDLQVDAAVSRGLNRYTPDLAATVGVSARY